MDTMASFESSETNPVGERFTRPLIVAKANRNLIRLLLYVKTLSDRRSGCIHADQFRKNSSWFLSQPIGALFSLLTAPALDHWLYLADCVRGRHEREELVTWSDLPAYLSYGGKDPETWLLADFSRFCVDIAVLTGSDWAGHALLNNGYLCLETHGLHIIGTKEPSVCCEVKHDLHGVLVRVGDLEVKLQNPVDASSATHALEHWPRIEFRGHSIWISALDPLIQADWVKVFTNPDGTKYLPATRGEIDSMCQDYLRALKSIESVWPAMAEDIASILRTIVPVGRPDAGKAVSCTSDSFFGAILCCWNPGILAAEVLIHETSHNIFNLLLSSGDLLLDSEPDLAVVYSPWREDPRPVRGCLHAIFVFERVCQFLRLWLQKHPDDSVASDRLCTLIAGLCLACANIERRPIISQQGQIMFGDIQKRVHRMYSEFAGHRIHLMLITQHEHYMLWCRNHPNLIAQNPRVESWLSNMLSGNCGIS